MKWVNHALIGGGLCFVFNPSAVPFAIAGSTAPDWLENLSPMLSKKKIKVNHREETHYLAYWALAVAFFLFVWDWQGWGFWFAVGGLTHVLADSCTVTGVRLGWWSKRRFHLFGGLLKLRTGGKGEYAYSTAFFLLCITFALTVSPAQKSFFPFFYNWGNHYERGVIDAYEWKKNRFRFI